MFDSPIARCEIIEEMVLIDETQEECAREHGCPPDRICPLARYFADPLPMSCRWADKPAPSTSLLH